MAHPVSKCAGTGMSVAPAMGNTSITPRRASLGSPLTKARLPHPRCASPASASAAAHDADPMLIGIMHASRHQTQTADGTSLSRSRPHTALCAAHKKTRRNSCPRASSWSSFIATRPVACPSPYSPYWRSITATVDSSSLCAISLSKAAKVDSH